MSSVEQKLHEGFKESARHRVKLFEEGETAHLLSYQEAARIRRERFNDTERERMETFQDSVRSRINGDVESTFNPDKCMARAFNNGMGKQCTMCPKDDSDYCTRHRNYSNDPTRHFRTGCKGKTPFGRVDEPKPIFKYSMTQHEYDCSSGMGEGMWLSGLKN